MCLDRELAGHNAGVECMALSADGLTLLSGGKTFQVHLHGVFTHHGQLDDDAVIIVWNVKTGELSQKINCAYHGPISAISWIHLDDLSEPPFVFGCADGSLHLYKKGAGGVRL